MANTTVNIDIQVQSKSINDLEKELAEVNQELKDVAVGSESFKQLSKESQVLTQQLKKVQQTAEGFTLDDKIKGIDGSMKLLGGSLSSVVGTLGILGVETEAFGEFEKKAASAIAVGMGFKQIGEGIRDIGPLLGKAGTAIKGFSITTRQALIATGIGAFVVALGTVIAYWDDITAAVERFAEKVPFVGKALKGIKNIFNTVKEAARPALEFFKIVPTEAEKANQRIIESNNEVIQEREREIAILEASGASAEEVFIKKRELLRAELDNLRRTNADKAVIYKKETELQALEAKDTTRISKEEQDKRTKDAKDAGDQRVKDEKKSQEEIRKAIEQSVKDYERALTDQAESTARRLAIEALTASLIKDTETRAEQELAVEKKKLEEERRLKAEAYTQMNDDRKISDGTLQNLLEQLDVEYAFKKIALERDTQKTIDDLRESNYQKEKARVTEEFNQKRESLQRYRDLVAGVLENIIFLSQQRYDREILLLGRERRAVETNTNLTEQQRIDSLNAIEEREREVEIRRIKAERDQFTFRQGILLAEEVMKTKFFVAEQLRINAITASEAAAAAKSVAIEGTKQAGKAAMSLGTFVAQLGPLGVVVFAASIAGILASIVSARKSARAQIASLGPIGGSSIGAPSTPSIPSLPASTNTQERAPQQLMASPMVKTYVLTGDITSGQEAQAKLNTKRTIS